MGSIVNNVQSRPIKLQKIIKAQAKEFAKPHRFITSIIESHTRIRSREKAKRVKPLFLELKQKRKTRKAVLN
ncbi:hypothetical protein K1719_008433 [Acacia pycnantha]|nr:hypothetical protein K1719_008433 [Acacia pycnantha]